MPSTLCKGISVTEHTNKKESDKPTKFTVVLKGTHGASADSIMQFKLEIKSQSRRVFEEFPLDSELDLSYSFIQQKLMPPGAQDKEEPSGEETNGPSGLATVQS